MTHRPSRGVGGGLHPHPSSRLGNETLRCLIDGTALMQPHKGRKVSRFITYKSQKEVRGSEKWAREGEPSVLPQVTWEQEPVGGTQHPCLAGQSGCLELGH